MESKICNNEYAHYILRSFKNDLCEWKKDPKDALVQTLKDRILYFYSGEAAPIKYGQLDTSCERFLFRIEKTLSIETPKVFRLKHGFFWDSWGHIAGLLLRKQANKDGCLDLTTKFKKSLKDDFEGTTDWNERKFIIRGFASLVLSSSGYEEFILETLEYYYTRCKKVMSTFRNTLPMDVQRAVKEAITAQKNIALRYSEGTFKDIDHDIFLKRLITLSLQSTEFINRICHEKRDSGWDNICFDVITDWQDSMFNYIFSKKLPITVPKESVQKEFDRFEKYLTDISKQQKYNCIHSTILGNWLPRCEDFRKNCL